MALSPAQRRTLLRWYDANGRHNLPWRRSRDPYTVLVSEIMLQQTQVDRVIPYFEAWMKRWPTPDALAGATPAEVLTAWAGLGYNRRAIWLREAAQQLEAKPYANIVPVEELERLRGVGTYTARAVASFAGEHRVAAVDTNVGRVLARVVLGKPNPVGYAPHLQRIAEKSLPVRRSRDWNLALMDLGAMVCKANAPRCAQCPFSRSCLWLKRGCPATSARDRGRKPPFGETSRFARGRIVDALRDVPSTTVQELAALLPEGHRERLDAYLAGLERDGLVERCEGRVSLPRA